jgi:REP element-mobilizing transposase RayT
MPAHKHLPHLSRIWINDPIYFITTCTYHRLPILDNGYVANILIDEWTVALERHGWMVGCFVIMPDHVHFFCSSVARTSDIGQKDLSGFMQQWKQWTSKRIIQEGTDASTKLITPIWQKEFFDHLLRTKESYIQKWAYVQENPVRKNLVKKAEDWPWQGEIFLVVMGIADPVTKTSPMAATISSVAGIVDPGYSCRNQRWWLQKLSDTKDGGFCSRVR